MLTQINPNSPLYEMFASKGIYATESYQLTPTQKSRDAFVAEFGEYEPLNNMVSDSSSTPSASSAPPIHYSSSKAFELARTNAIESHISNTNELLVSQGLPEIHTFEEAIIGRQKALYNMPTSTKPLEAVTDSGVTVTVQHTWVYPEGTEKTIHTAERGYAVTLSRNGEEVQRLDIKNDVRITEREDGTFDIVKLVEGQTTLEGTGGDDIIISQFAKNVSAGNGDDIIFALNDGLYDGEEGNDTFVVGGMRSRGEKGQDLQFINGENAQIKGGNGNDTVTGGQLRGVDVDLGEGDNFVYSQMVMQNSTIQAGSGNNHLLANVVWDSNITFGDGANTIQMGMVENSSIRLGHGGNDIVIEFVENGNTITSGNEADRFYLGNSAPNSKNKINLGRGDNSVDSSCLFDAIRNHFSGNYAYNKNSTVKADVEARFSSMLSNVYV